MFVSHSYDRQVHISLSLKYSIVSHFAYYQYTVLLTDRKISNVEKNNLLNFVLRIGIKIEANHKAVVMNSIKIQIYLALYGALYILTHAYLQNGKYYGT